jgi:hypothetical protein
VLITTNLCRCFCFSLLRGSQETCDASRCRGVLGAWKEIMHTLRESEIPEESWEIFFCIIVYGIYLSRDLPPSNQSQAVPAYQIS